MLERLLHRLDRHRWVTLGVVLAAVLAAAWHLPGLQVLDSPERWMPRTTLDAWRVVERHFDIGDSIGIGLHFHRPLSESDLTLLKALRHRLEAVEGMSRVYDCSLVAEEIERVPLLTLLAPENAPRFAVYGGALWDSPSADDPSRMLMTVCELTYFASEATEAPDRLNQRRRHVAAEVERIVDEERAEPRWRDVEFHAASGVMMMGEMEKRTRQVAFTFLPLSLLIGLVALLWGFRSWQAFVVAVLGSAASTLLILGWLAASGGSLGVVTMATPALISVIATAATIHFAAYAARSGTTGAVPERSHLVSAVCVPCLGSALTTGLGFLLLWFNELAPIRDLGVGMFAGSLLAFLGVYMATHLVPIGKPHAGVWLAPQPLHRFCRRVTRFPLLMLLVASLCAAGLIYVAWPPVADANTAGPPYGVRVNTDPFSFFSDDQPIKRALRRFAERKFPIFQLDVVLVPKEPQRPPVDLDPPDPQNLANRAAAQAFAADVARQPDLGVVRVLSTLAMRERYEQFLSEMYDTYDAQGPLAALYQFGTHASSANRMSHSFQSWTVDKQEAGALRFTFVARDDNRDFSKLVNYVREHLPEGFRGYLTGSVAQSVNLADGLRGSVVRGLGASLIVMGLICILLFRSLRLALIGAVPNIFPILVVFGVMGWFDIPIGSGSAMEMTVALGIGLTDTIHFLMHYRRCTRELGEPVAEAVQTTIRDIGRPLVMTSLVHVAGFAIFLCTDFVPLRQFGLLASIAMLAALAGDLVLLPNLLLVFDRVPRRKAADVPSGTATASVVGEHHLLTAKTQGIRR
jgi:predicted RND superfamily exporter protein